MSPTQQLRYISSLPIPENEDDLIAFISFLREGAMGKLSKFKNVADAYHRKYDEAYAVASHRKLSYDIARLDIKESSAPQLIRGFIALAIVALVVIVASNSFSGCERSYNYSSGKSSTTDLRAIKEETKRLEKLADEKVASLNQSAEEEIAEAVPASDTDQNANIPDEPLELKMSGKVGGSDVIMEITFDFEGNRAWGTYRYKKGAGDIVLMGDVTVTEADEYSLKYTTTLQEIDNSGNPYGTFELNGMHMAGIDELNGKYISVKGKESNVTLFKD